jgi:hypothetical protein
MKMPQIQMPKHGHLGKSLYLRSKIGRYPALFYSLYGMVRINRELAIQENTQLVIEGYPRCANTFAVVAFNYAQNQPVNIAHHMHVPAQIIRAAQRKIPTILLIRNPKDAIVSCVIRDPRISLRQALQYYISFYQATDAYKKDVVVATFEQVTQDYATVIQRVNQKFQTAFTPLTPSDSDLDQIFAEVNSIAVRKGTSEMGVSRPSQERKTLKQEMMEQLDSSQYQALLRTAEQIYHKFIA